MKKNKDKCRIRYTDTMTSYLLDYVFDIKEALDILVGDDDKRKKEVKEVLRKLKNEIEEKA